MSARILATGGAGYIGSHVLCELLSAGYEVIVLDNLSNSSPSSLDRVAQITNRRATLIEGDVRDPAVVDALFASHRIDAVVHMAGVKAVGESMTHPEKYHDINIGGAICLFQAMLRAGVGRLLFSSSATVYGMPRTMPITENTPHDPQNTYGRSKAMVEHIASDMAHAHGWRAMNLRYFNPVGAHPSGLIGEDPRGIPNNLFPFIAQVATGKRDALTIFGNDYDTPDGTGVRDYIHVVDLARGHLAALEHLLSDAQMPPCLAVNLGTGRGASVLEVLRGWERALGRPVPHRFAARRPGDVDYYWADPALANRLLGWQAGHDLDTMCADHWAWQSTNPDGYDT